MVNVRELLVPVGVRRKGKVLDFQGVTVHNVDNESSGANADANVRYQASTPDYKTAKGGTASWHYTVDEKEIVRSIPEDEVAYHCGNNEGNNTTVSVEICDNADGDILKATDNAAELTADILKRHGHTKAVWGENLFQHHDWANKDCPSKIRAGKPYGWETFVAKVNEFMGAEESAPQPTPAPEPEKSIPALTRNLKLTDPMMRGDDVRQAQERLEHHLAQPGKIDGVYGKKTKAAVIRFQKARIAEGYDLGSAGADGVIGPKTWKILW